MLTALCAALHSQKHQTPESSELLHIDVLSSAFLPAEGNTAPAVMAVDVEAALVHTAISVLF